MVKTGIFVAKYVIKGRKEEREREKKVFIAVVIVVNTNNINNENLCLFIDCHKW